MSNNSHKTFVLFLSLFFLVSVVFGETASKTTDAKQENTEDAKVKQLTVANDTYWITSSSGVIHNSSCRYFKNSNGHESSDGADGSRNCKICGGKTGKKGKDANNNKDDKTIKNTDASTSGSQLQEKTVGSQGQEILTGPKGGKYYINKNGNKTYIKRK